jgi:hypothetical protein
MPSSSGSFQEEPPKSDVLMEAAEGGALMKASYDPIEMLAIAKNFRQKAETADPAERDALLSLAHDYEEQVQQSFHTPIICNAEAAAPQHYSRRRPLAASIRGQIVDEPAAAARVSALETVSER